MLYKSEEIIQPETLQLLRQLQSDNLLADFFLVGGTALALQMGHRLSVDLDFFTIASFEPQRLEQKLVSAYGFQTDNLSENTLIGSIQGIKTDFITHAYPLIKPLIESDNLRLASLEDVAAMKLNAISISGQRLKDFIDIYFLLEKMPLAAMLEAYKIKYRHSNELIPLKALTYFNDIDLHIDKPVMVRKISLHKIKKRIVNAVEKPRELFKS